ncbi:TPA: heavy metal transporter [Candidatus Campbellbacteria bacterium]|nr:MAG: Heavy metal-associated domain, HMA [Candidatus Campbellbacteria bacterium GW2011_OD1_34_28]KKP75312.1 MAG: hypothetical protein UR74_C0001G0168 [Candidatus Campbellbacteria bacterium GW2011_GWD2_35_24]KKP76127.1 MAG: heavy metal transport/detoxification protein [Candidatus Campbellbacteria bacterium GW2011_GWC2_35_28]KKP77316.1 MAG: hypothetical protein UR76_C0001G0161 [Candidatus Campbellbacteria bacterium GW2011_GWC1_35_31]KKP79245.1 MAG: hypothetical protein UR79_C0001G0161 [Candidat
MQTIKVVNMKCGGCEKTVTTALEKEGFTNISVKAPEGIISFDDGNMEKAEKILSKLGYPKEGTPEAESVLKKAKSYASCAIGKMK